MASKELFERSVQHLRKLLKNEKSLQLPVLQLTGQSALTSISPTLYFGPFLHHLQRLSDQQTKAALNAMNSLQTLLFGGILAEVLIAITLATFFCLNITNRLLIILNNTACLSKGTTPNPPLKGTDEIAELDQFLFKSATEIRELERFKRDMIGVVSHELKSPLSSVGGFISSLNTGVFGELTSKTRDKVERIDKSVKRLMALVKELLYLDRLELEMMPEDIDVAELIATSVDTVKELSERSGIEIVVSQPEPMTLFADRNRLVQVIVNLLSNALKFSPQEGKVTIETILGDACFQCRISDQGRGIPEDLRKQIFEPFKQIDAKDDIAKKGTGLGLTISRSIVEQHGGTIGVDSVEGKGSTFWFKIPASAKSCQVPAQKHEQQHWSIQPESLKTGSGMQLRKFSVLKQGLVIIAVPLIFQLAVVSAIGYLISQLREQTRHEQDTRIVMGDLCRMAELLATTNTDGVKYVFTRDTVAKASLEKTMTASFGLLDHAIKVSTADPEQLKDLRGIKAVLIQMTKMIESEALKGKATAAFSKLYAKNETGGLIPFFTGTAGIADMGAIGEMLGPDAGISPMELVSEMQAKLKNGLKAIKLNIKMQKTTFRLLAREKLTGEKLAAERARMIRTLEFSLIAGIVLNTALSIFLAVTLTRSLTSRLQHVMENMARLVSRESLHAPIKGSDEIAYLDNILFETGKHLVELEAFKNELISIVSHELRTPLLSISASLELFDLGTFGELSEKGKSRLRFAREEANRLIRLINDLLDIEKMQAGKFLFDKSEFELAELIQLSIASVASLAEQRQIRIESIVPSARLFADRDRLCQVLINLLSNAIKFSPDGAVINVIVESTNSGMEFRVADQGRGIPEELRQKIFERFIQVETADANVRGGSGLGLTIAKAIVEQHGGSIGADSQIGKGSVFWFRLPMESCSTLRKVESICNQDCVV